MTGETGAEEIAKARGAQGPIAAIDVGTNSVLLTIARIDERGELVIIAQRATVTRLGQGVDQTGHLHPDAEQRTLSCLEDYRSIMDACGVTRGAAVGTSALRDAKGGEAFLEKAAQRLGFPLEVISGLREAELTFAGALFGLSVPGDACVFDIGGGSTELILGHAATGAIVASTSLNIGSVRLTERFGLSDPPTSDQWRALKAAIAEQLELFDLKRASGLPVLKRASGLPVVGVAGTVTTLAAIEMKMSVYDPELIHGAKIRASAIADLSEKLFFMPMADRLQLTGLSPGRADVIGAGAALCSMILQATGAEELIVSDRGVRFGLLRSFLTN